MAKKMIDLFAGAGGLTWGFYKSGFKIVETIENWLPATLTYNKNFKTNIIPLDITSEQVKNNLKKYHNKIDLVIGGFPCQGFSLAGKRLVTDARNKLYLDTIEVISNIKPMVAVLENVKGILSYKDETGTLVTKRIVSALKEQGFYCNFALLDTSNFGVPQKRERVIFVVSNIANQNKVDKTIEILKQFQMPKKNVKDAIYDLRHQLEDANFNHIFTKHSPEFVEKIKNTIPGESVTKKFSDAFRRLEYHKPSYTVKENHGGVHVHPEFNRVLTPRELARLQSFPDDFVFLGTKSNILKQIGNAVPPLFSKEIAKVINKVFFNDK